MNEEKEPMQTHSSAGEYAAPEFELMNLKHRGVICASGYENTYGGYSEPEEEG